MEMEQRRLKPFLNFYNCAKRNIICKKWGKKSIPLIISDNWQRSHLNITSENDIAPFSNLLAV